MKKRIFSIITLVTVSFASISAAQAADMTPLFSQDFGTDVVTAGSDSYATYTKYQTGRGDSAVLDGELVLSANTTQGSPGYYLGVKAKSVSDWNSGEGTSNLSVKFRMDANTDYIAFGGEVLTTDAEDEIVAAAEGTANAYVSGVANDWGRYRGGTNSQSYLQIYPNKIIVFDKTYNLTVSAGSEHTIDLYVYGDNTFSLYLDETEIAKDTAMEKFVVRYNYYAGANNTKQRDVTLTDKSYFRGFYEVYLMHYAKTANSKCLESSVYYDDLKISTGSGKNHPGDDTSTEAEYPTVYIEGYQGASTIPLEYADSIPMSIIAESETLSIEEVTLSVDGAAAQVLAEPYGFDAATLGLGTFELEITATNSGGYSSTCNVTLNITKTLTKDLWTEDFTGYSLSATSNGISFTSSDSAEAYAKVEGAYDGDGIVMGMDPGKRGQDTTAVNQYMTVSAGSMKTARISFDVKIDKKSETDDKRYFTIVLRDDISKGDSTAANMQHNIEWRDKLAGTIDYEEDKWYRIVVDVDANSGKCSITLTDKETGEAAAVDSDLASGVNEIDFVRIHSRRDQIKTDSDIYTKGNIYVDNFTLTAVAQMPEILSVSPVSHDAQTVSFTVAESLLESSVTKDNISLVGAEGEIPLKSASYNDETKTVTLTPSGTLRSLSTYTITLSENIRVAADIPIGLAVTADFTTGRKDLEFSNVSLSGSVMSVTADATQTPQSFCMIVSVWKGNEFVRSHAKTHTITTNGTFTLDITPPGAGERAELYIWDSLANKTMLLNEVE